MKRQNTGGGGWGKRLLHRPLIILIILILMASGAGAAVGTILLGEIESIVHVTVSQAVQVEKPRVTNTSGGSWNKPWFSSVKDDYAGFSVAVEVAQGDKFIIVIPLINRSEQDIVVEMSFFLNALQFSCVTFKVRGSGVIDDVVRISRYKWKFTLDGSAAGGNDAVKIKVLVSPTTPPGFYEFEGMIQPVAY